MNLAETIYQRSLTLPDEVAREALDFIEFLGHRYGKAPDQSMDASDHAAWFRAEVERAQADTRPVISHEEASEHFAARREAFVLNYANYCQGVTNSNVSDLSS